MFDPKAYYERVIDVLWSNRDHISLDDIVGFNVLPPSGPWQIVSWRGIVNFEATGHKLEVYETYSRDTAGVPLRRRNYRLTDSEENQIFLFDMHGRECRFNEPCHLHTSTGEEIENGHGRLCGYDLTDMDFLRAFSLAYRYIFDGEALPWE